MSYDVIIIWVLQTNFSVKNSERKSNYNGSFYILMKIGNNLFKQLSVLEDMDFWKNDKWLLKHHSPVNSDFIKENLN